jgi:hypothetical protein
MPMGTITSAGGKSTAKHRPFPTETKAIKHVFKTTRITKDWSHNAMENFILALENRQGDERVYSMDLAKAANSWTDSTRCAFFYAIAVAEEKNYDIKRLLDDRALKHMPLLDWEYEPTFLMMECLAATGRPDLLMSPALIKEIGGMSHTEQKYYLFAIRAAPEAVAHLANPEFIHELHRELKGDRKLSYLEDLAIGKKFVAIKAWEGRQ